MSTLTKSTTVSMPVAIRRFATHFLEMCVVMCMGGILLDLAVFGVAGALGLDLVKQTPELAIMIVAADFALVMAVYMYVRGHPAQHNIEMSGSTLVGGIAFVAALWVGWVPRADLVAWNNLFALMCGPLCVLMFAVMVVRFDHYGGRVGAAIVDASSNTGDFTCPMHPEVRQPAAGRCPACGMKLVRRS